jgi:hypothetical protein
VKLAAAYLHPKSAPAAQRLRLFYLSQTQHLAIKVPRFFLCAARDRNLHVVNVLNHN